MDDPPPPDGAGADDPDAPREIWQTANPAASKAAFRNVRNIRSLLVIQISNVASASRRKPLRSARTTRHSFVPSQLDFQRDRHLVADDRAAGFQHAVVHQTEITPIDRRGCGRAD